MQTECISPVLSSVILLQVFTSDHALKLDWIPKWIAIIGSGYIGLEFSDVYTALGSEVTFIEVVSVLPTLFILGCSSVMSTQRRLLKSRALRIGRIIHVCLAFELEFPDVHAALRSEVTFIEIH